MTKLAQLSARPQLSTMLVEMISKTHLITNEWQV